MKASPEILRQQIELVLDVRQAWQQVDKPNLGAAQVTPEPVPSGPANGQSMAAAAGCGEVVSMNWTA